MDNIFELCKTGDLDGLIQLEKKLDINKIINHTNKYGWTPFITATIYGHLNIVKYFVANGCNINVLQNNSNVLYHVVLNQGNKLNKKQLYEILNYLINELNNNINQRDTRGNTLLHYAIINNKVDSANILLDMGINKYCQNQYTDVAFDLAPNDEILERIHNKYVKDYLEYIATI